MASKATADLVIETRDETFAGREQPTEIHDDSSRGALGEDNTLARKKKQAPPPKPRWKFILYALLMFMLLYAANFLVQVQREMWSLTKS